jgi:hypothetical protein
MPITDAEQAILDKFLLIVCKTLNPFVELPLLKVTSGHLVPVDGATSIDVSESFKTIHQRDKDNGTHNIAFIINHILLGVQDLGFSTSLSAGALVKGQLPTLGNIVNALASGAERI